MTPGAYQQFFWYATAIIAGHIFSYVLIWSNTRAIREVICTRQDITTFSLVRSYTISLSLWVSALSKFGFMCYMEWFKSARLNVFSLKITIIDQNSCLFEHQTATSTQFVVEVAASNANPSFGYISFNLGIWMRSICRPTLWKIAPLELD